MSNHIEDNLADASSLKHDTVLNEKSSSSLGIYTLPKSTVEALTLDLEVRSSTTSLTDSYSSSSTQVISRPYSDSNSPLKIIGVLALLFPLAIVLLGPELRTASNSGGNSSNSAGSLGTSSDDSSPVEEQNNPFENESFPKDACGDSLPRDASAYPVNMYPVYINSGQSNLNRVTSRFCRDAYPMKKKDTGEAAIQVASFITQERAEFFAQLMRKEMGSGEVGPHSTVAQPQSQQGFNAAEFAEAQLQDSTAITLIEMLYRHLSRKNWLEARQLYSPSLQDSLSADFFGQFDRVTITNLQVTSRSNSTVSLMGRNTYVWPDGTSQDEERTFQVSLMNGQPLLSDTQFVKVLRLRG